MPKTKQKLDQKELKKLIESCDFIPEQERKQFTQKSGNLKGKALEFTYKKFKDAKNRVENIYISIALQYDPTGGALVKETLKTIQEAL